MKVGYSGCMAYHTSSGDRRSYLPSAIGDCQILIYMDEWTKDRRRIDELTDGRNADE